MTTLLDLTNRVHSLLHSSTGVQESMTWLTAPATSSALTLSVDDSSAISKGISEVGDELVYVSTTAADSLVLAPFGRGFRGSTAAAQAVNTPVTFNPTFPLVEIKLAALITSVRAEMERRTAPLVAGQVTARSGGSS